MLLNKFQHQQEKARRREEMIPRKEDHWRCPFFVYCWEEGIKLPLANNCPKCNGLYHDNRSIKRSCFDDRDRKPITQDRRDHDDRRIPVHDWLGGRVSAHDRLEEMANDRVPDEEPMRRDP